MNSQASPLPPASLPLISFALAVGQSPDGVKLYFHVISLSGGLPTATSRRSSRRKRVQALASGGWHYGKACGRWTTGLGSVDTSTSV